jgi:hypothetical protein
MSHSIYISVYLYFFIMIKDKKTEIKINNTNNISFTLLKKYSFTHTFYIKTCY